jgi:hypothetical protein
MLSWSSDSRRATSNAPSMISSALIDPRWRRWRLAYDAALGTVTSSSCCRADDAVYLAARHMLLQFSSD